MIHDIPELIERFKNYTVLSDRVFVLSDSMPDETPSGIIIPDIAKDDLLSGTVLAVGTGAYDKDHNLIPMRFKPGQKVLMSKYAGEEEEVEGVKILIVRNRKIYATDP